MTYPTGFSGGSAPTTYATGLGRAKCIKSGVAFKMNPGWQGHNSNVNKIAFTYLDQGGDAALLMYGPPSGPYEVRAALQFRGADTRFFLLPNKGSKSIGSGEWHVVDWQLEYSSDASTPNGTMRWWVDGTLIGEYLDIRFPGTGMTEFQVSPTWGGMGDTKRQTDYMYFDHVRVRRVPPP